MTPLPAARAGVLNSRWRQLLDGRAHVPTCGEMANDPAQAMLWEAKLVRGEVGILVLPKRRNADYLVNYARKDKPYPEAMWGVYRAFLEQGMRPD
ncbi:hypothetical protein J2J97_29835 (plasmid) [Rhizobium bangladeshense]|nr:hypothetical protein [Rhizobium bangladeshense]MBY3584783.1 hypothetical protein [Rhizobium bangladeshense]QSY98297.1 hypothetical protein J2J97_29835 [Rhizobium bangladeshense]